jgi:ubiquinol-cytochrome c reductase iron-sulfur subunit
MNSYKMNLNRRKFLTNTTAAVGGIGMAFAGVPFVGSWLPSAKTKAMGAPVEIDISQIEQGQKITIAWRGQPVFIVNRTPEYVKMARSISDEQLRDPNSNESLQPEYANNDVRSIRDNILVLVGLCTHLGCVPLYKPKMGELDSTWKGGFFCPCHGSKFDLSGRVFKGVPAPTNLSVPPHKYVGESHLVIGEDA